MRLSALEWRKGRDEGDKTYMRVCLFDAVICRHLDFDPEFLTGPEPRPRPPWFSP